MWYDESVIYQIYPLGLCGAPAQNDGVQAHRILRLLDWVDHIAALGCDCVLFNPLFESDAHGYDTRDFFAVDCRLGTKEDLKQICNALHAKGIRVMFDAVLNHVGRGFWAFRDVQENRRDSAYQDWFNLSFDGNSAYNDGFWYDCWEGCQELVKLNLGNPAVRDHLFSAIRSWVEDYDIDGLRLDVCYCLDSDFLYHLRRLTDSLKPEFALVGETLHGDYRRWMNDGACQFGSEDWCLYSGRHLLCFADNHDVTRIASQLEDKAQLKPLYGLLFTMPGVPSLYYGSEWGTEGRKQDGDAALRPAVERPEWNKLTDWVATMAKLHRTHPALIRGGYHNLNVQPKQLAFVRWMESERVLVAVNADSQSCWLGFQADADGGTDLLTGAHTAFNGGAELPAYSCTCWKLD